MNARPLLLILLMLSLAALIGSSATKISPLLLVALLAGAIVCLITFVRTDIALAILIFSMLLSPEFKVAEVPGRAVVLRLDDFLVGLVVFTWLAKMAVHKELGLFARTPLNLPISLYTLACILFTARGVALDYVIPKKAIFYIIKYIEYFLLYFMVANSLHSKKQIERFIILILIVCAIVTLYGWKQIGTGMRVTAPFEGPHGEPATIGGYLLLSLAMLSGLALYTPSSRFRFWPVALILFIIPPFLHTLSRASFMAIFPMYFTLILLTRRKKALLTLLVILAIMLSPVLVPESIKDRVTRTFKGKEYEIGPMRVSLEGSAAARLTKWKDVVTYNWPRRPFFGYGITGLGFIDSQYVRTLGELGIVGLGIFIWLLIAIFRNGLRTLRVVDDPLAQALSLGFLAGFSALLIHAITANTFIIVRIMEPFWFIAAMVMMLPRIIAKEGKAIPTEITTT